MQRIAIINTGLCNVDSIWRAIEECGAKGVITDDPSDLGLVDKIVLPGVGAFADAMHMLNDSGLTDAIRENVVDHEVPVLGVCLGMQLLATRGTEGGDTEGLGLIDAQVVKLVGSVVSGPSRGPKRRIEGSESAVGVVPQRERVPHMGWNAVYRRATCSLLAGIPDGADFYFVHSFHMQCVDDGAVVATTPYCGEFTSVVADRHVFGTQFHPEKSQAFGRALLSNFVGL